MNHNTGEKSKMSEEDNIFFKAAMSRSISAFYLSAIILLGILVGAIIIFAPLVFVERVLLIGLFALIDLFLLYMLFRAYRTRYTLDQDDLNVYGAMGTKKIPYGEIGSIKKSAIPSGFRLYGSSFLGGWYYLPGIGRTWVSMTNFRDGVLISTLDDKLYLVTPAEPERFIRSIKERVLAPSSVEV
jgi:hypothetical protein